MPSAHTPSGPHVKRHITERREIRDGGRGDGRRPGPPDDGVTVRAGTAMSAALSPDGSTIAFDCLGTVWTVPSGGGEAVAVLDAEADAAQPHWSPCGNHLVFQSYRDGNYHLCLVPARGGPVRRLTSGPYDHREPCFAPDGRRVAFSSDRSGRYAVHVLHLATGAVTQWGGGAGEEGAPAWSPDGQRLVCTVDGTAIDELDARGNRRRLVPTAAHTQLQAPFWTPDGAQLGYVRLEGVLPKRLGSTARAARLVIGDRPISAPAEDVFGFRPSWHPDGTVVYTADGGIRRRAPEGGWWGSSHPVPFAVRVPLAPRTAAARDRRPGPRGAAPRPDGRTVRGIVSPALSPDGTRAVFCALGGLWLATLADGLARPLVRDGFLTADPAWSPDGTRIVYTSDRSGTPQLWVHDLAGAPERQLTDLPYAVVAAAWSPDGSRIACQDQDGNTRLVPAAGHPATAREEQATLVLGAQWQPGRPSWSPDGARLVMAVAHPYSERYREGTNRLLVLDLRTGAVERHEPAPHRSVSTRGDDGPVWSPDGSRLAFTMGGALHTLAVDAEGRPCGELRQLTEEAADAPSWSADAARLLYLHHGQLRMVDADGARIPVVPPRLPHRAAAAHGHERVRVLHVGRVWDGAAEHLREDVDLVVVGDRIAEIAAHRPGRAGPVTDASALTVIPGLADMHVHPQMKGRFLGARQGRLWLSFGVTTLRSAGDPAYAAAQEREALAEGARLGPRYFSSTEPIDGSRVHYGFMRPTTSPREIEREVARALALEPHLLKAYVRLGWGGQRALSEAAGPDGPRVTSHYLYPSALLGLDGLEHLGASNRLGYAQTMSRCGHTYGDVVDVLAASGMTLTPTLFASAVLLADEGEQWLTDPRITTLYPSWEVAALRETVRLVVQTPGARAVLWRVLASNVALLRRLVAAGGRFVSGTDAPIDHTALSLHLNLRAMVACGLSPHQALVSATTAAADCLGLGGDGALGVLGPGRLADLVFVEGDPLTDITAAARVRMTMVGGALHTLEQLLAWPAGAGPAASGHPLPTPVPTSGP